MSKKHSNIFLAKDILNEAKNRNLKLITAESCTAGLISATLTSVPGSSLSFNEGYITYSNESKIRLLNVSQDTIKKFGAVSKQVVKEMAIGAAKKNKFSVAISISGVAGPESSENKPVGMIWVAVKTPKNTYSKLFNFGNLDRNRVRKKSVRQALKFLLKCIRKV